MAYHEVLFGIRIHEFIICLGYKQYVVKEFFADYFLHTSDVTFDLANNKMEVHNNYSEPWKVTLVDTGLNTMTGGRVKRIQPFVGDEPFMLTYGDGVSTVDLDELVRFHKSHGRTATITTVNIGQMKAFWISTKMIRFCPSGKRRIMTVP